MNRIVLKARAKINWTLGITGKREDGYHLLDMLLHSISLYDRVKVTVGEATGINLSGSPFLVRMGQRNIAYKAAETFYKHTGIIPGCTLEIVKKIPVCAGMGGGSADCAAVLFALNRLHQTGLTKEQLKSLAMTLGADVPFMLQGGLARAQGIGDRLIPLRAAGQYECVGIMPFFGASTKEIFSRFDLQTAGEGPDNEAAVAALQNHDLLQLSKSMGNMLQPVTEAIYPKLKQICASIDEQGALRTIMTGSGSFVYGLFESQNAAMQAQENLVKQNNGRVIRFHTESEGLTILDEK